MTITALRKISATGLALLAAALFAALMAAAEGEKDKGSAQAGRTYANAACAECHSIEQGAKSSPVIGAPPFVSLTRHIKLTERDIEGWLTSSHQKMPDFSVPAGKRADLIAYIKSLALAAPPQN